jgi:hypothetical protein
MDQKRMEEVTNILPNIIVEITMIIVEFFTYGFTFSHCVVTIYRLGARKSMPFWHQFPERTLNKYIHHLLAEVGTDYFDLVLLIFNHHHFFLFVRIG